MLWETITSVQNPLIKRLHQLHSKKSRDEQGSYLVEGIHLVEEACKSSQKVETLLFDGEAGLDRQVTSLLEQYSALNGHEPRMIATSSAIIEKLSETKSPQGIVAELKKPSHDWNAWWSDVSRQEYLVVVLDEIQDPGNLGTILRTADAAGADGVILCGGNVDLYNGKVVRSTMGSLFRVPVFSVERSSLMEQVKRSNGRLLVTSLGESSKAYDEPIYQGRTAIVIGNEGRGVSPEILRQATETVHIPLYGQAESLNAAVATGIMLYEARRQRK
ncbi:TrmH family RNA methyltransferase [Brevibacillus ginsengisoli]|uniref:TrmH family RNA methyltransferase n=1 Tax=Brevibacillus ginsengisoli TaxID=363854 RepID=UPI003CEA04C1